MATSIAASIATYTETDPYHAARTALLAAPSPETFATVCGALADLADAGNEVDRVRFLDCADRAQNLATACGLVGIIGQDAVQAIMVEAFGRCRVHHQRSPAEPPSRDEAAESTVEALMFSLRKYGVETLSERACLRRLANLSSDQIREIVARLIALRRLKIAGEPLYPKIDDELLLKLGDLLL
jgi:hypothetical protein